jgi:hypothetical protein
LFHRLKAEIVQISLITGCRSCLKRATNYSSKQGRKKKRGRRTSFPYSYVGIQPKRYLDFSTFNQNLSKFTRNDDETTVTTTTDRHQENPIYSPTVKRTERIGIDTDEVSIYKRFTFTTRISSFYTRIEFNLLTFWIFSSDDNAFRRTRKVPKIWFRLSYPTEDNTNQQPTKHSEDTTPETIGIW